MKGYFRNKMYAIIFPLIVLGLASMTYYTTESIFISIIGFFLGIMTIQLNFIVSHMWAHSLMLEYGLWNVEEMIPKVGYLPLVMFYAFYHHHHTKNDNWMKELLSYKSLDGAYSTAVSHWESFSLFTINYPLNGIMTKLFLLTNLYFFPAATSAFFLGYEFGVILLPISHDWVHERKSAIFGIYHFLKFFEKLGLFAQKKDHKRHHSYHHSTIYQGFTSSGLYSKDFDIIVDHFWDYLFELSNRKKIKLYKILWLIMSVVMILSIVFSVTFLILFSHQVIDVFTFICMIVFGMFLFLCKDAYLRNYLEQNDRIHKLFKSE